jgi:hypothetical protein
MALTANESLKSRGEGEIVAFAVKAATHIYRNAIVGIEVATGLVRGAIASVTPDVRAGIAREEADNSAGAAGDIDVEVYTVGEFLLTGTGFAQTDVGAVVYAAADDAISLTSTNNVVLGRVTKFVSSTQVWVRLLPFAVAS